MSSAFTVSSTSTPVSSTSANSSASPTVEPAEESVVGQNRFPDQDRVICYANRSDEEWANALTHGFAALSSLLLGAWLAVQSSSSSTGLAIACLVYTASVVATFTASTLSHTIFRQPLHNTMRAWDQAMIYAMISGTYTPIIYRYAPDGTRTWLLLAIWVAALTGIVAKLLLRHRINNITTVGYLLLGWLPSIPLFSHVPSALAWGMLVGGVLYSVGVIVLTNDYRAKYLHAVWHLLVMAAALVHCLSIRWFVIG